MNIKKFLVIGSNSFSGSHFVAELLKQQYEVCAISRSPEINSVFLPYRWNINMQEDREFTSKNLKFYQIDLNNQIDELMEIIDLFSPAYIVNFAAQGMVAESWINPTHWYQTNVLSQVALHDELRKRQFLEKYVHVTTPEVYGSTDGGWINEETIFAPSTPYAVSRAACDLHLKSFHKAYDFPVVFTRAANVYGPGQQLYRIIPRAMISARTSQPFPLHGGGISQRSFIHIKDVVKATIKLALNAMPGSTWHLSTEKSISIRELVEEICKLTSVDFNSIVKVTEDRLGKDQSYLLESKAMRNQFGWKDDVSLLEGLEETLQWVDINLDLLVKFPLDYIHKI